MYSQIKTEMKQDRLSMNLTATVSFRVFTILIKVSKALQSHALTTLLIQSRTYGLLQRILFPKNMTTDSRIYSRKSLTQNIRKNLKQQVLNISILLLTTQLQELSVQTAATSGHAKTMTATLCQIWYQPHSEVLQ